MCKYINHMENRRKLLVKSTGDAIIVIGSNPECYYNTDCTYLYRQNTNLYYYCVGLEQPNSTLVIDVKDGSYKTYLFIDKYELDKEIWHGKKYKLDEAKDLFKVDDVYENTNLIGFLTELIKLAKTGKNVLYNCPDKLSELYKFMSSQNYDNKLVNIIEQLRNVKTADEISIIKIAAHISSHAHTQLLKFVRPNMMEYEVDAYLMYEFMRHGSRRVAYNNIVASGINAVTLHYDTNNKKMLSGELLLVDAGCEYGYYASDITRTIPVNGKFTDAQKQIYQLVLDTQKACIEMVKPGVILTDLHKRSVEMITEGLINLDILVGTVEDNIKNNTYKQFYMHGLGHWMGMDVHDNNTFSKKDNPLVAGNIFTVEPGIYIRNDACVPDKFKGIGVRIEDDVLVTDTGYEVLTTCPKEIVDIEHLMQH